MLVVIQQVTQEGALRMRELLGEQQFTQMMQDVSRATSNDVDKQQLSEDVGRRIAQGWQSLSREKKDAFMHSVLTESPRHLLPAFLIVLLLLLLVVWTRVFALHVGIDGRLGFREAVERTTGAFPRMIGLSVMLFFASCLWAPIIGLLLFSLSVSMWPFLLLSLLLPASLGPRFLLAPVISLREGGIVTALRRSFDLTKGHWWRVFGTVVAAVFCAVVVLELCLFVVNALMASVGAFGFLFFLWLRQVMTFAAMGYVTFVLVSLEEAVSRR